MDAPRSHDTAVVLHLYYPDMWVGMRSYLASLGDQFDLFVTLPEDAAISEDTIAQCFPEARIHRCENRGRDVAPFLRVLPTLSSLGYRYICKIHTKKSPHILDGEVWHTDMLDKLLGSATVVAQVKTAFDTHPHWGLIAPQGHVLPLTADSFFWGGNEAAVFRLARAAGIPAADVGDVKLSFAAGSMFWFRPHALDRVLDAGLRTEDFEAEQGQVEGTLAHAVERFFGLIVARSGFEIAEVDARHLGPVEVPFQLRLLMRQAHYLADRVHALSQAVAEKDARLHDLSLTLGEVTSELAASRHHVEALLSSASWRWMAPLRAARRLLMRDKR